jgi:hypothetical protein
MKRIRVVRQLQQHVRGPILPAQSAKKDDKKQQRSTMAQSGSRHIRS